MGTDMNEEIEKLIQRMRGFNNDPKIVDQRAKSLVITKLEEAKLWFTKVEIKDGE